MKIFKWMLFFGAGACAIGGSAESNSGGGAEEPRLWSSVRPERYDGRGTAKQDEWVGNGSAYVAPIANPGGDHAIVLPPRTPPVIISRTLPDLATAGAFVLDWYMRPAVGPDVDAGTAIVAQDALLLFDAADGEGRALWWDGPGGGEWRDSSFRFPLGPGAVHSQTWLRVTLVFEAETFSLLVDGHLVKEDLPLDALGLEEESLRFAVHGSTIGEVWFSHLLMDNVDHLLGSDDPGTAVVLDHEIRSPSESANRPRIYADIHQMNRERAAAIMAARGSGMGMRSSSLLVLSPLEK